VAAGIHKKYAACSVIICGSAGSPPIIQASHVASVAPNMHVHVYTYICAQSSTSECVCALCEPQSHASINRYAAVAPQSASFATSIALSVTVGLALEHLSLIPWNAAEAERVPHALRK
jgi:hypothetical protein